MPKNKAIVFHGSGGCEDCPTAAATLLNPETFDVIDVGPGKKSKFQKITSDILNTAQLWVQPGDNGSDHKANKDFSKDDHKLISAWVASGGRYLGICMGAYLAGKQGFGFLPYSIDSYVDEGEVKKTKATTVKVDWSSPLFDGHKEIYYQDGPFFREMPEAMVIGEYKNGMIAAMIFQFGKGKVGLLGVHPEAPKSWLKKLPNNLDIGREFVELLMQ